MRIFCTAALFFAAFSFVGLSQGWNWDSQQYYGGQGAYQPTNQDYYDGGSQVPVYNMDPSICFEPGWDFGGYFSSMFASEPGVSDAAGGGIMLSYFFDRNIGLEANYALHGQAEAEHIARLNAVYRLPIDSCHFCGAWAPYVFGGPGYVANGEFDFFWTIGGGAEVRFQSWGCTALFLDYSYNLVEKDLDFSQVRLGFKLPF